jgi:hypothetical protein
VTGHSWCPAKSYRHRAQRRPSPRGHRQVAPVPCPGVNCSGASSPSTSSRAASAPAGAASSPQSPTVPSPGRSLPTSFFRPAFRPCSRRGRRRMPTQGSPIPSSTTPSILPVRSSGTPASHTRSEPALSAGARHRRISGFVQRREPACFRYSHALQLTDRPLPADDRAEGLEPLRRGSLIETLIRPRASRADAQRPAAPVDGSAAPRDAGGTAPLSLNYRGESRREQRSA